MQQEQVLGELFWYANQTPHPDDAPEVSETLAYLKVCHLLFEGGFLSHNRIRSMDYDIMKNITKGYKYFSSWQSSILDEGIPLFHNHNTSIFMYIDFQSM